MKHEMEIGTWMIQLKKNLKQQNLKNHSTRPLNDIKRLAPNHRYIHDCKNINCIIQHIKQ
jgi:hypothetical protein